MKHGDTMINMKHEETDKNETWGYFDKYKI